MRLDHLHEDASPVSVSQAGLIRLSGPARAIALDVLRVNSLQTGAYVSHFRGRGMEFDESRPYQPGDDPRSIDWRVTARSTTAYTKLFREERERPVLVVVDLRSTMHFATQGCFKSVNASRAAALLAWSAHHRGDRLGGLIFGDTTHRELKPRMGRLAALRFVHELQLSNMEGPCPWGMECTAGTTTLVLDHDGDFRACEMRPASQGKRAPPMPPKAMTTPAMRTVIASHWGRADSGGGMPHAETNRVRE